LLQKSKRPWETNSHGLHYEETKKPWGLTDSPMAPFYYMGRLRDMDEPCQKRRKSKKRNWVNSSYVLPSKLCVLFLSYFSEKSRRKMRRKMRKKSDNTSTVLQGRSARIRGCE